MLDQVRDLTPVVDRLTALLGDDAVRHAPEQLAEFLDPYPLGDPAEFSPGAVVSPGSVEEVQAVVRVANELRVPLWATSRGKNNGYGGASPRLGGCLVVELSRMDPNGILAPGKSGIWPAAMRPSAGGAG